MSFEVIGQSANGKDMYASSSTRSTPTQQKRDYDRWQKLRRTELEKPDKAQRLLEDWGEDFKIPIFIQGGIHGNESEGIDAT